MLTKMISRNRVRLFVLLLCLLIPAVIVAVLTVRQEWDFDHPVTYFNALTGGFALSLWAWANFKIGEINAFLKRLRDRFNPERLLSLHARIVARTGDEGTGILADLARDCRMVASRGHAPHFARRLMYSIAERLDACLREPDNSLKIFDVGGPAAPGDPAWRGLAQFLLTALLFTGIIGTFFGLLGVFTPTDFLGLFNAIRANLDFEAQLHQLLSHFALAFGASLVAYLAYLFGRFSADLVDEAHDGLAAYLTEDVASRIRLLLTSYHVELRLDLPEATKTKLDRQAAGMIEAAEQGRVQNEELRKILARITRMANLFNRASQRALSAAKTIGDGLEQGRREWHGAAEVWRSQTERFANQASGLGNTLNGYVTMLGDTRDKFSTTAQQVMVAWSDGVQRDTEKVDEAVTNITATWREENRKMAESLSSAIMTFKGLRAELNESLASFVAMREVVTEGAQLIADGQRRLEAGISLLIRQERETSERVVAMLDSRSKVLEQHLHDAMSELARLRGELHGTVQAASDLRTVILGSGQAQDLLTTLGRIDETLVRMRATYGSISAGGS